MAYIKIQKFKEALFDCEQALIINPKFSKAHMRAYTCYFNQGLLQKANETLKLAIELGDATAQKELSFIAELLKQEDFAEKALMKKEYRESIFYFKRITESCPDSVKHTCLYLESLIASNPFDMTDCVSYTTKVQNKFIEHPDFLFWRGRILIYNGQLDMGKKHIKQALSIDPDCARYQKFWKNL